MIRRCREVAARLREGRDKGEEMKKLMEELDKLREEHKSIKDRLVKIEASASTDGKPGKRISKNGRPKAAPKGSTKRRPAASQRKNARRR